MYRTVQNDYICTVMARNIEFIPEEKIEKAMQVFWCKGYTAASLADLTEAMQLNKSSLYNSFGDKHTLFKECLKNYGKLTEKDYAAAIDKGINAISKLDNVIDTIVSLSTERPNSCLGVKTSFELASDDKEVHDLIKVGNDRTIGRIRCLMEQAQSEGDIRTERNVDTMAHFLFNSFSGLRQSFIIYEDAQLVLKMGNELKVFLRA